jgi:protocatechuate 3,4-dioxygenase beta subunit
LSVTSKGLPPGAPSDEAAPAGRQFPQDGSVDGGTTGPCTGATQRIWEGTSAMDDQRERPRPIGGTGTAWNGEYRSRDRTIHPPAFAPAYKTSVFRSPRKPLLAVQQSLSELTGPVFGHDMLGPLDNDLLLNGRNDRDPIGERIIVHGQVLDENGRPVPGALLEVWQANAGGRYRHVNDHYVAALDPNFLGYGRVITDADGWYKFRTIKPGPYPWRNRIDDWRPAHIHFSIFGHAFVTRLITQLYFEGDPLLKLDPIYNTIPDADARERLVAKLDMGASLALDTLGYRFDIVLRGRRQTPFENKPQGS